MYCVLDSLTKIRTYVSGRLYIETFLQKLVAVCISIWRVRCIRWDFKWHSGILDAVFTNISTRCWYCYLI